MEKEATAARSARGYVKTRRSGCGKGSEQRGGRVDWEEGGRVGGKAGRKAEAAKKRLAGRQAGGRGEIAGRIHGRKKRRSLAAVSDFIKGKRQGRDGK